MVVFVRLDALLGVLSIYLVIIVHPFYDILVNWYWIKPYFDTLEVEFRWHKIVPRMFSNLVNSIAFFRISI